MVSSNPSRPAALVFDMDDTLYPESSYARSGLRAVASEMHSVLGIPDLAAQLLALYESGDRTRVYNRLLDEVGRGDDPALLKRMIETHRNHEPEIELYPDAEEALAFWCDRTQLGLISDGYLVAQRAKVAALGLTDRVNTVILTDEKGREFWKPHPWAFEEMAGRLGAAAEDCVYVADNPTKDFVAPNNLGWRTVQILRADGVYADCLPPDGGSPTYTITSLAELVDVLAE